ncbi:hypothetical protein, partial [Psychrobacter sp. APC 3350]|uniref:hypothetical protein n=1 Tax=Psychrobacter sp. APC 3350 TaxID=3035195 RepID=UPI0025B44D95
LAIFSPFREHSFELRTRPRVVLINRDMSQRSIKSILIIKMIFPVKNNDNKTKVILSLERWTSQHHLLIF